MHDEITDLTPEAVWYRSPLSRAAVDRILAAPKLRLPIEEHTEALRLVLAKLADLAVFWSMQRPAKQSQSKSLSEAFEKLLAAHVAIHQEPGWPANMPPGLPAEWVSAMKVWQLSEFGPRKAAGRKTDALDAEMFPRLLAFFELTYNKRPSYTRGGPTLRFLTTFFVEMETTLARPQETGTMTYAMAKWTVPSEETLREKVRRFLPASLTEILPQALFTQILDPVDLTQVSGTSGRPDPLQ